MFVTTNTAANAHRFPGTSNTTRTATILAASGYACQTQITTFSHVDLNAAGYAWTGWCGGLRIKPVRQLITAVEIWKDGHLPSRHRCWASGWNYNHNDPTARQSIVVPAFNWDSVCGKGVYTVDTFSFQFTAEAPGNWFGGWLKPAGTHDYRID